VLALAAELFLETDADTVGTPLLAKDIQPFEQAETSVVLVPAKVNVNPMGILLLDPSSAMAPPEDINVPVVIAV